MGTHLYKANNWLDLQENKGSDPKVLSSYKRYVTNFNGITQLHKF